MVLWWTKHQLSGCHDVQELVSIREECVRRAFPNGSRVTQGMTLFICTMTCTAALDLTGLGAHRWAIWLLEPILVTSTTAIGFMLILRTKVAKVLPGVLQNMGRCVCCGYLLNPKTLERCPECGSELRR